MVNQIRVGIIGLGVGEKHIEGYESRPDCEVVALCDFDDKKVQMAEEKYPQYKVTKSSDEILEDPDINVVSIASYDNYHYEQIVKALENGKHVFVEKPFCMSAKEAIEIRRTLNQNKTLKISSNLILRQSPRFLWLKNKILKGELGELSYLEGDYNYGRIHKIVDGWRGKLDFYSVMYGGGVHIIDLILWLTEDEVVEVSAMGNNIASKDSSFGFNDLAVSLLKFKSGAVAKVSANFGCVFPHFHCLSVYGKKGTFVNDMEYGRFYTSRNPEDGFEKIDEAYPGVHKGGLIESFVDSILDNSEGLVSSNDVFRSMSVCFAIEEAINSNKPVRVNYI